MAEQFDDKTSVRVEVGFANVPGADAGAIAAAVHSAVREIVIKASVPEGGAR